MTPPDTNLNKQKRRHRGPLIGMGLVAVFGVGLILYWIAELIVGAPGPEEIEDQPAPAEIREGDVEVPDDAPSETVEPGDPDVEVDQ